MATQTKEEIAVARRKKQGERKAEQDRMRAEYEVQKQEHLAMYKASVPKRLMEAQALASWLGIAVHVSLTATGPSVRFEEENHHDKLYIDETITYETEEWELENLEATLASLKAKRDAYDQRRIVAQRIFSNLSDEEKICIKEHIHYLR